MIDDRHPGEVAEDLELNDFNPEVDQEISDAKWLGIARNTYSASTDYLESSVRGQWEKNLNNFRLRHGDNAGRKKKMFRPKIRSSIRAHEAALAAALFTNNDLVSVEGANKNDPLHAKSARLNQELLQHRLNKTIPWFTTVCGAYQDTHVHGVCISKVYWEFEAQEEKEYMPLVNEETGEFMQDEEGNVLAEEIIKSRKILSDKPVIDLIAPENFRFDPNADWRDPISNSPYLIEMIPMFAGDVLEMMGEQQSKDDVPAWREYSLSEIISAGGESHNNATTRQAREGQRQDPREITVDNEFKSVWVHFNIYRKDGIDWAFYTVGTTLLLSDPVPLESYLKIGRESYRVGFSGVEAHRNYPSALAELGQNLQEEINILADQRFENVRLVLNKRYFIRRQGNVDLASLMRNVPGGGIMIDDVNNDVRVIDTPDVTSSSYAEQDRLNMDMDEMLGTFSPSTVQSNRSLNETVGGMNLMNSGANAIQEYMIRTFIETWVEPVLSSLIKLEQLFETDEVILGVAADKAGIKEELEQAYGGADVLDKYIHQNLTVTVNVGMGNTNPEQKINKIMMAVNTTANFPGIAAEVEWREVAKEIYSFAGYGDGDRFMKNQEGQQAQQQPPPEVQVEQMRAQARQQEQQMKMQHEAQMMQLKEQGENERFLMKLETDKELELMKLASSQDLKLSELEAKLNIEGERNKTNREVQALKASIMNREMNIKNLHGTGI
jgi:hypothetical protein